MSREHRESEMNREKQQGKIIKEKAVNRSCRDTALQFLSRRERSVQETRNHLIERGFDREEIEEELSALKEFRYLDDDRYAESYIRYAKNKGRGPSRIALELKEKGLDSGLTRELLKEHFDRDEEKEAAMREAMKLLRTKLKYGEPLGASFTSAETEHEDEGSEGFGYPIDEKDTDSSNVPDEKMIAKIGRRLASLGYRTDVIYDVLGRIRKM